MLIDFTFKNELIQKYFDGDNSYVPSSELIYLHEHPLVKQSFLIELEELINKVANMMIHRNMKGQVVQKFIDSTQKLGVQLPTINKDNAPIILDELRKVYALCKKLLK